MDKKNRPLQIKGAGPEDGLNDGQFEGYCAVFGNVDSYGDVVERGAFTDSLDAWKAKGDPIPLLWGHDMHDPFSVIGQIDAAEEDDHGLKVRATFDLDNPKAAQVYALTKTRRITGMSFAYDVLDEERKDGANHLRRLHIYEASIVPIGANPEAGVEAVKAVAREVAAKAGRVISARNETTLRQALTSLEDSAAQIKNVLAAIDGEAEGQERVTDEAPGEPVSGPAKSAPSALTVKRLAAMQLAQIGDEPKWL